MFCPECGQVYQAKGNFSNQPQPNWEKESRITNLRKTVANHIEICDLELAPDLAKDYIDLLSKELNKKELNEIKNYAKLGCLIKVKEG